MLSILGTVLWYLFLAVILFIAALIAISEGWKLIKAATQDRAYRAEWERKAYTIGTYEDCHNHPVEKLISYTEFMTKYLPSNCCHDFIQDRFLFDEGGADGFSDTVVGFYDPIDAELYLVYLKLKSVPYHYITV